MDSEIINLKNRTEKVQNLLSYQKSSKTKLKSLLLLKNDKKVSLSANTLFVKSYL